MADIRATKNGNWSDATVWAPNLPAAGDVVRPNNFTVTIDVNVTVTEIRNDAGGGAVVGGSFTLNDGVTVTASNGFFGTYQNTAGHALLVYAGSNSVTINGDLNGSQINVSLGSCLLISSTGTATVNGNLSAASGGPNGSGIRLTSTGTIILNGTISLVGAGTGIRNEGNGNVVVNNNITVNTGIAIINTSGTVTITGNITTNAGTAITNTSGTVTITGDLITNAGSNITNVSGVITITGNVTNAATAGSSGAVNISNTGAGIINVIGTLQGNTVANASNNDCILNSSSGTVNITGNLLTGNSTFSTNPTVGTVIRNTSNGVINITGNVTGPAGYSGNLNSNGSSQLMGVRNATNGTINIIGNCNGTIAAGAASDPLGLRFYNAVSNITTGIVNITGNVIGGSTGIAVANHSTGTVTVNGNAIGGTAFQAIEGVNAAGNTIVEKIVFGANGQTATRGYIKFKNTPNIAAETVLKTDATTTNLVDINVVPNLQPAISDVRLGVTYSSGSLTGTMNVPPFNAVKAGVPVDNGVGTAALTPQDVWNVLISGLTQSGSIGERLKNVATVETTGTQIASFNV